MSGSEKCRRFAVGGISLSPDADAGKALDIVAKSARSAGLDPARLAFDICKRSVDARKKNDIKIVYSVLVSAPNGELFDLRSLKRFGSRVSVVAEGKPTVVFGEQKMSAPPLVVGMGPAGLFCALMLAENGYCPIIIDRGDGIKERCKKTEIFARDGVLDTDSNIQFGAGGAGTFSDGKLVTRISDARVSYVLERFCDFGAPEDIRVNAKPHIGTDLLLGVVERMLAKIEELGGRVIYRARLTDIEELVDGNLCAKTTAGDIFASCAVLATGHSAHDIYDLAKRKAWEIVPKAFSLGVRIEHLQADIDRAMYGDFAGHSALGAAEYHLSDTTSGRGVYTFCMCPGGEVVAATSDYDRVVTNGMSRHARDGKNANSALLVSVRPEDFGNSVDGALEFQAACERAAFTAAGGDYYAPCQTVGDFLSGGRGTQPKRILPTYRGGKVRVCDLHGILPQLVCDELALGLRSFDRKIAGFAASDAILTGVETRSSAPVRIVRTEGLFAAGHDKIYPCGEGAGYAGGITSAATDGIRVAQEIMRRWRA